MHIIEVIPITRGAGAETLSYFCPVPLPLGAVVSITVRTKIVQGVVVSTRAATELKSDLKQASFSLKKISTEAAKNAKPFFSSEFMTAVQHAADYYAARIGNVLATLIPEVILSNISTLDGAPEKNVSKSEILPPHSRYKKFFEIHTIQGDDEERYGSYRGLIRQEFARSSSILILLPTAEDAARAYTLIEKGIEGYAYLLHSSLSKKKITETWNAAMSNKHPVAIIATGSYLSIPRHDLGAIIVEKENSRGWKQPRRPFVDIRHIAELYAEKRNIPLFVGDIFLTIETLWRESEGEIIAGAPFKFRTLSTAHEQIIDMRTYANAKNDADTDPDADNRFRILSNEAENLIRKNKANSEHMIIFILRRGHAPSVICGDCQTIVTCTECSKPIVLHKAPGKTSTFFLCHRCGARRSAKETCTTCGSWKLTTLGIGIDLVAEYIRKQFPDMKIFQIDSDSTPTDKQARSMVSAFRAQPGSILLGTEMMLSYIHEKADNAIVVSVDSLLSIPDFRIHEKILHILLLIRSLTLHELIVQTRKIDEKIFEYALKGTLSEFFRSTIEERKNFSYPPFSTLIKLTLEGKKDIIVVEMAEIKKKLEEISGSNSALPYAVDIFPAFTHTVRGNFVLHGLVRIPCESGNKGTGSRWPDAKLSAALRALPPSITVNVDPDTLL